MSAVIYTRSSVTNPLILFLYQNIAPPASRTSSSRRSTGITMEAVPDTDTNTKTHQVKLRGKKTLSFIIERSWVRFCHKNSVLPPKTDSILLFLFQYCLYFCRFTKKKHTATPFNNRFTVVNLRPPEAEEPSSSTDSQRCPDQPGEHLWTRADVGVFRLTADV